MSYLLMILKEQIQFLLLFLSTLTHTISFQLLSLSLSFSLTSILRLCFMLRRRRIYTLLAAWSKAIRKWRRKRRATYKTIKKVSSPREVFFLVFLTQLNLCICWTLNEEEEKTRARWDFWVRNHEMFCVSNIWCIFLTATIKHNILLFLTPSVEFLCCFFFLS